jgi:hypothetical protein
MLGGLCSCFAFLVRSLRALNQKPCLIRARLNDGPTRRVRLRPVQGNPCDRTRLAPGMERSFGSRRRIARAGWWQCFPEYVDCSSACQHNFGYSYCGSLAPPPGIGQRSLHGSRQHHCLWFISQAQLVIAHGPLQCASSEEELRRRSEWFAYSDDTVE